MPVAGSTNVDGWRFSLSLVAYMITAFLTLKVAELGLDHQWTSPRYSDVPMRASTQCAAVVALCHAHFPCRIP